MGFGVTGFDVEDVLEIIDEWCREAKWLRPLHPRIVEDVDISLLQQRRELPLSHFGVPSNRGLWYPRPNIGSFYPRY